MTPLEAVMWRAGTAPDLRPDFLSVTLLARPPGRSRLRRTLSQAATVLPTLRRTVRPTGWPPGGHEWLDDPGFDIDEHVRRVSAPGHGRQEDVLGLVAGLIADPPPVRGPSWEVVVVEGLDGGGAAVVQRLHHSIADGVDAVRLWRRLLSERDPPGRSRGPRARVAPPAAGGDARSLPLDALVGAARQGLAAGLSIGQAAARAGVDAGRAALEPRSLVAGATAALHVADELRRQVVTGGHLSPLMTARSTRTDVDVLSVPLTALRTAARAQGAGPNDAVVAGVAAALGDYHHRLGHDCAELRLAVPVRRPGHAATARNGFAPMRLVAPVAPARGADLLPVVADRVRRARTSPLLALTEPLAAALNLLPTPLLVEVVRSQTRTVDAAVSLVTGMRRSPSLAGAPIRATYPFGPRLGAALNVTALPMGDRLDLGVNIDPAAVTEPAVLASCLRRSFGALAGR